MKKFSYLIVLFVVLTSCSIDTKSGLWENKNLFKEEKEISEINFNENLTFSKFKENVVLFGKKSKYPVIMKNK